MKKNLLSFSVVLMVFFCSGPLFAVSQVHMWLGITSITFDGSGDVVLSFDQEVNSSCTNPYGTSATFIRVGSAGVTPAGAKNMIAAALAAMHSNTAVTIHYEDSSPSCWLSNIITYK